MSTSDWVTWEVCLRCGGPAAVGWAPVVRVGGAPGGNRAVEFDCPGGCQVGLDELAPTSAGGAG